MISQPTNRRDFLARSGMGFASMCLTDLQAAKPHHASKAKRVIHFFLNGGPSHVDTFDPKPALARYAGKSVPSHRITERKTGAAFPSPFKFERRGQSGIEVSELFAKTAAHIDDIAVIRSMQAQVPNHEPSLMLMNCGDSIQPRPSMGAWLSYGLGCETDNLPTFVVMTSSDSGKTCGQLFFDYYWGSGFLPSRFQGVRFRNTGDLVPYLANPAGVSPQARRALLDDIRDLNGARLAENADPEIETRIAQYEMAFRMQSSVPDLVDFSTETRRGVERYGPDALKKGTFANNCLIARRLLERGVRFVQLMHSGWDQHGNLHTQLETQCRDTEGPSAALVMDLKERGMLDDTLVVWGGEFGRTPFGQGDPANPRGRDHFGRAYSWWLAGGGIKPGTTWGATDDFAWNIVRDKVHVHDMQATMLHLCGINHERLTFRYQGRQYRLTDIHGSVVKGILA